MQDMLAVPSESVLVSACFRILGKRAFYTCDELAQLRIEECDEDEVLSTEHLLKMSPLGIEDVFERFLSELRAGVGRKLQGMVFTPENLVRSMVALSFDASCRRVVDCGCGAGRFALHASYRASSRHWDTSVVAVDSDPLACLLTASAAAIRNLPVEVLRCDFLDLQLPPVKGKTLFLGNPPYIRHHSMSDTQKEKGHCIATSLGMKRWSKLSGMHACFLVKCLSLASEGDGICFLTGSEWLDVKYGEALRSAFLSDWGGGYELVLFDARREVFKDVMSTALISRWLVGKRPSRIRLVSEAEDGESRVPRKEVSAEVLAASAKWTRLFVSEESSVFEIRQSGSCRETRLGDLFSVSRGLATGCNNFFALPASDDMVKRLPECFIPVISHAREVIEAGGAIDPDGLAKRLLVCTVEQVENIRELAEYLLLGEEFEVDKGYVASRRKRWWQLSGRPAPLVATYMARGLPTFALNPHRCLSLNTVHGLYPRFPMSDEQLTAVVEYLNSGKISRAEARVYQGGLYKYEPREMERIAIPTLEEMVDRSRECPARAFS